MGVPCCCPCTPVVQQSWLRGRREGWGTRFASEARREGNTFSCGAFCDLPAKALASAGAKNEIRRRKSEGPRTTASCVRDKLRPERGGKHKLYKLAAGPGVEPGSSGSEPDETTNYSTPQFLLILSNIQLIFNFPKHNKLSRSWEFVMLRRY